jgi:hypothetical protein
VGVIEGSTPRGAGVERGPGTTYYADANNGSDSQSGDSWQNAKLTIASALALMSEGDTLYLSGKFREECTLSNLLGGVSIIGADDRLPAHADAPWPSGASWLPPASPTAATSLLVVRSQGVTLENILFDAPVDAAAVKLSRNALSGDSEYDASHANIKNCRFTSGDTGIENDGGCGFVVVEDCRFYDLTNAIKCTSTSVAVPLRWIIRRSYFIKNTNHLISSLTDSVVEDSVFTRHTTEAINAKYNSNQGEYNTFVRNALSGTYSIVGGYTPGANDEWGGNFNSLTGGVTAADPA